jgi:acetoin utilization deacetylase AcuC-like enzyme
MRETVTEMPEPPISSATVALPGALLVDDPRFDAHAARGYHPERPERLAAAREAIRKANVAFQHLAARAATDDELARVHDARFVESLDRLRGQSVHLDPDTYVAPASIDAARLAAGGLVAMVDAMIDGPVSRGVALLRPPGHHARPSHAMGFCLVNNVAVAAAHARARGLSRVLVLDWDVHHGNGTQEMFYADPSVFYVSTHQFPFYPGTGAAEEIGEKDGKGFTINVPLTAGGGDAIYRGAFERVIMPVVEEYRPELVLVSAGFDAAARDPLASMQLSDAAFGWMARELAGVAERHAKGRMAIVLEGGYDLVSLEGGLTAAVRGMLGGEFDAVPRLPEHPDIERAALESKRAWRVVR